MKLLTKDYYLRERHMTGGFQLGHQKCIIIQYNLSRGRLPDK